MKNFYRFLLIIYILTIITITFVEPSYNIIISVFLICGVFFIRHQQTRIIYLIFCYLSQVLGTTCYWYRDIPYYDKCVHVISGALIVFMSYQYVKSLPLKKTLLYIIVNTF